MRVASPGKGGRCGGGRRRSVAEQCERQREGQRSVLFAAMGLSKRVWAVKEGGRECVCIGGGFERQWKR